MTIFESFKDRQQVDVVQARKTLTRYVFQLIAEGQTDEGAFDGIGPDLSEAVGTGSRSR